MPEIHRGELSGASRGLCRRYGGDRVSSRAAQRHSTHPSFEAVQSPASLQAIRRKGRKRRRQAQDGVSLRYPTLHVLGEEGGDESGFACPRGECDAPGFHEVRQPRRGDSCHGREEAPDFGRPRAGELPRHHGPRARALDEVGSRVWAFRSLLGQAHGPRIDQGEVRQGGGQGLKEQALLGHEHDGRRGVQGDQLLLRRQDKRRRRLRWRKGGGERHQQHERGRRRDRRGLALQGQGCHEQGGEA
mmetsp:Transcript_21994/g.43960  ORF Transcript_21994/g.43960 Transcript_21994/m.43960 type:complete len:245 (+) Transcript_21994:1014-1748(+)